MTGNARLIRTESLFVGVPYAYAAGADADARLVFLAGACPLDRDGAIVARGDVGGQAAQCVANLRSALHAAGAEITDVVFTRVLVASSSRDDLTRAWDVVHDAFAAAQHEVPSTLFGVTVLGWEGQLVEVEAVAAVR